MQPEVTDNNHFSISIKLYFDLSKVFDTSDHQIWTSKLENNGTSGID